MSQIPKAKSSLPKPSLAQVATATGSQLDLLAGRNEQNTARWVLESQTLTWVVHLLYLFSQYKFEIKRQDSSVQFLVYWIKALVALKDWLANLEGFWLEHWGGDDWCQRIVIKSKFRLKPENRRNHVNEWEIIWFHIWRRQIVQTDRVKGGVGK